LQFRDHVLLKKDFKVCGCARQTNQQVQGAVWPQGTAASEKCLNEICILYLHGGNPGNMHAMV
jgi:hypothetical protein